MRLIAHSLRGMTVNNLWEDCRPLLLAIWLARVNEAATCKVYLPSFETNHQGSLNIFEKNVGPDVMSGLHSY